MLRLELLHAEVVYNGLGTPRTDAAAVVQDDGTDRRLIGIERLERARSLYPEALERDAGFAVSLAPVNAHTHMDLSDMPYTPGEYIDFILAVVRHTRAGHRGLDAARRGVDALLASGVHVVGDIVTDGDVMRALLSDSRLQGVAYWEVFAPREEEADQAFERTRAEVEAFRRLERPGGMRVGVSPHTPHSVSAPLLQRLAVWCQAESLPMQIHVAETAAETALHHDGSGPLAELLRGLGVTWRGGFRSPVAYLDALGVLATSPTLVHMVAVDEEDVRLVQRAGSAVVHCARSNEALGSERFPWEMYAKHAVDVAIGTDSLGSSPSLSVVQEVAAARLLHGAKAAPQALVRAAVKGGHRALGLTPPRVQRGDSADNLFLWSMYTA